MEIGDLNPDKFNNYLETAQVDEQYGVGSPGDCPIATWLNHTDADGMRWSVAEDYYGTLGVLDEEMGFQPYAINERWELPRWAQEFVARWDSEEHETCDPLEARTILKDVLSEEW